MKKVLVMVLSVFSLISCKDSNKMGVEAKNLEAQEKQATIDSMKMAMEKTRIIDSMKMATAAEQKQANTKETKEVVVVNKTESAPKHKKWSGAAKGAVIGAGVGAVTGAIISKKKGQGAIIGGLAGAGVGAGTGAIIDDSKKK